MVGSVALWFLFLPFQGEGQDGDGVIGLIPIATPPSSTAGPGDVGEDCLSAQREFRSRPVWRAAQGTLEGRWIGVAFFWLLFLAKQEK